DPKPKHEAVKEAKLLVKGEKETNQLFKARNVGNALLGKTNALLKSHKTKTLSIDGEGKYKSREYWMALLRQMLVAGLLRKDIESYGVIRLSDKSEDFLKNGKSFMMSEDHQFEEEEKDQFIGRSGAVADEVLMRMLKD